MIYNYQCLESSSGCFITDNMKTTMQNLNNRLENYVEKVKNLERANTKLERQIIEFLQKRGPGAERDYSKYKATIADLKSKIFNMKNGIAGHFISLENAEIEALAFQVKMEDERRRRQVVEADVSGIRKMLDDVNILRLHLESDVESRAEERATLMKYYKAELAELQAQIMKNGVQVEINAPKGQDLANIMEEMRAKYERIVLKNQEELKSWHESRITEVQEQVTQNTTALKNASSQLSENRRTYQTMDIELQSILSLKEALEASLWDTEMRNNMEIEKYNNIILRLKEELTGISSSTQQQTSKYQILLDIKMNLEAEIAEYRRLLGGEPYHKYSSGVEEYKKTIQTQVVTITQTLVDGKVVSESKDVALGGQEVSP